MWRVKKSAQLNDNFIDVGKSATHKHTRAMRSTFNPIVLIVWARQRKKNYLAKFNSISSNVEVYPNGVLNWICNFLSLTHSYAYARWSVCEPKID